MGDGRPLLGAVVHGRGSGGPRLGLLDGAVAVFVGYWVLQEIGALVQYTGGIEVAWLPVGFAAAMLYLGDLRWFVGGMLADLSIGNSWRSLPFQDFPPTPQSWPTTAGNTIEFTAAAILMRLWLGRGNKLERPADVWLLFLAIAIGTAESAVVGTLALVKWAGTSWSEVPSSVRTWWLGDTTGGVLIAPLLIAWGSERWRLSWRPREAARAAVILAAVVGVNVAVFSSHHPLTYVVFPMLVLAAVYLGQRGATVALVIAYAVAVGMTAASVGPFAETSINDETLNTQLFILVATVTTLTLGAAVSARRRAAVELAESRRREAERAAEERQRIARDLHDSVSQTLFSLGLHAGIAKHEVARAGLDGESALPATIDAVSELAQGALLEMRASIFELRGTALAEQGLVAALGAHGAAVAVRHDVEVTVDGPPDRLPLTPEDEELLYRIGQEAITNAAKHSRSRAIIVAVSVDGASVILRVEDHGVGFDSLRTYGGHLGLELMRSRAADAGGELTIESSHGAGTTIRAALPANAATAPPPAPLARRTTRPASVS